jgi:gluconolactonase
MSRRVWTRLLAITLAAGCSSTSAVAPSRDPATARDATAPQLEAGAPADASRPAARADAASPADAGRRPDAGSPPPDAALPGTRPPGAGSDAAPARDAASPADTGTASDAGVARSLHCEPGVSYGDPLPPAMQRQAKLVRGGFGFIEGPLWLAREGVLLFSDLDMSTNGSPRGPSSQIRRFTPPSTFDVLVASSNSNGLALGLDGRVVAATHDLQTLSYFDGSTGAREPRTLSYEGKHFNSPNDLAVRSDGNVYFSDPDWQLGPRTSETGMRGLYRVAADGTVSLLDASLNNPNGVALSPDEATLYVGSSGSEVFAFTLAADGGVGARRVFASPGGGSDGMSVDCAGNVYVTSGRVQVFSPAGQKLGEIAVAETPSNVAFGGPVQKTLFITAGTGLYQIELNVPGRAY